LFLGYWPMFSLGLGLYVLLNKKYTLNRVGGVAGKYLPISLLVAYVFAFSILAYHGRLMGVLEGVFRDGAFGFAVCVAIIFWLLSNFEKRISFLERDGHALVRAPLKVGVFLGSISYSLYLLHAKLYQIPAMAARQLTTPDSPAYIVAVFLGTVALSWVFYLYFERPFISRRGLPRFSPAIAFLRPIKF
jgi:peptidoglycan/LPS O-acetylase OafA/YrhL